MSTNPFNPNTILLAKHAQHVVIIHFPIALLLAGVLFDFVGQWKKSSTLSAVAYFNFLLAAISTIPAIATGILAWRFALEGEALKGILLMHLISGWLSAAFIWSVWSIHWRARKDETAPLPSYRVVVEALAVLVVGMTGHLGGFLSGVNGPS